MQKTEWRGQECPPLYTERLNGGQRQITVYIDVHEEQPQEESGDEAQPQWVATAVTLPVGICDRDAITSAIINAKYTPDEMQAIQNNFLRRDDAKAEKHQAEFWAMQDFRDYAKATAVRIEEELTEAETQPSEAV